MSGANVSPGCTSVAYRTGSQPLSVVGPQQTPASCADTPTMPSPWLIWYSPPGGYAVSRSSWSVTLSHSPAIVPLNFFGLRGNRTKNLLRYGALTVWPFSVAVATPL